MPTHNHSAVVIKPKRPFAKWVNWAWSVSGGDTEQPFAYFQADCSVVVIPKCLTYREAKSYVSSVWDEIFEAELEKWLVNEPLWPHDRTQKMFWLWFGIEFHSTVY
jgi:hypothetical protein